MFDLPNALRTLTKCTNFAIESDNAVTLVYKSTTFYQPGKKHLKETSKNHIFYITNSNNKMKNPRQYNRNFKISLYTIINYNTYGRMEKSR